jgi:hypothetical protein
MNGPEHYRTAEVLLTNLRDEISGMPGTPLRTKEQQAQMIAEAQVHATLALVAATALSAFDMSGRPLVADGEPWAVVA